MKQITLVTYILILIYSCNEYSTNNTKNHLANLNSEKTNIDSINRLMKVDSISNTELYNVFKNAVLCFPNDSSSLYRFYFERYLTNDKDKINEQISRLKKLTSQESVEGYKFIESNLKPLMIKIVNSDTITKIQSDTFVKLYSVYDSLISEALFSKLLTNEEDYSLVWKTIKIMVRESSKDAFFISSLIELDKAVMTNVELAEAITEFNIEAIQNNPEAFLEICKRSQVNKKQEYYDYIIELCSDNNLYNAFVNVSKKSGNNVYRKLANDLLGKIEKAHSMQ